MPFIEEWCSANPFIDRIGNHIKKKNAETRFTFGRGYPGDSTIAIKKIVADRPAAHEIAFFMSYHHQNRWAVLNKDDLIKRLHFTPQSFQEFLARTKPNDRLGLLQQRNEMVYQKVTAFQTIVEGLDHKTVYHGLCSKDTLYNNTFLGTELMKFLDDAYQQPNGTGIHVIGFGIRLIIRKDEHNLTVYKTNDPGFNDPNIAHRWITWTMSKDPRNSNKVYIKVDKNNDSSYV